MRDVFTICQGNIYDPGPMFGNWNLVISCNNHNIENDIFVCVVIYKTKPNEVFGNNDIIFEYDNATWKIICDRLISLNFKKLGVYKGTISDSIMKKVKDKLKSIFFDMDMYTLAEAREELINRETILKAKYSPNTIYMKEDHSNSNESHEDILPAPVKPKNSTNINLSLEDREKIFANEIGDIKTEYLPIKPLCKVTPTPTKKVKKEYNDLHDIIYKNYKEFILDYYTLSYEQIRDKYKAIKDKTDQQIRLVASRCRKIWTKKDNIEELHFIIESGNKRKVANIK